MGAANRHRVVAQARYDSQASGQWFHESCNCYPLSVRYRRIKLLVELS